MRLSQGHLNLLKRCPRHFQHTYLDQIGLPTTLEQQERQTCGSHFHLLMQQQELGLPIEPLVQADPQMQRWMSVLTGAVPEILAPGSTPQMFRESEHYRTLQVQDYLLTVIYDLLITDEFQAQILDWKTYPKPQNRRWLEQNWQTLLYPYVLAETSNYLPEQISLTYWFIQTLDPPQSLKFTYSTSQHQQTGQKLQRLLNQLRNHLQSYEAGEPFPQVREGSICDFCQFAVRCGRDASTQIIGNGDHLDLSTSQNSLPNLADIQEISL